jgi:hypothetical protein
MLFNTITYSATKPTVTIVLQYLLIPSHIIIEQKVERLKNNFKLLWHIKKSIKSSRCIQFWQMLDQYIAAVLL